MRYLRVVCNAGEGVADMCYHRRNDNDSNPAGAEMKHSYRPLDIRSMYVAFQSPCTTYFRSPSY